LQLPHPDALLLCHGCRDEGVMRTHLHSKGSGPTSYFHTHSAQTYDAQGFAPKFGALKRFFLPFSGMHQFIGTADMASHGEHHRQCVLSHGDGVGTGSIHDGDALASGSIEIDVVNPHPGTSDHPQLASMFEKLG